MSQLLVLHFFLEKVIVNGVSNSQSPKLSLTTPLAKLYGSFFKTKQSRTTCVNAKYRNVWFQAAQRISGEGLRLAQKLGYTLVGFTFVTQHKSKTVFLRKQLMLIKH